MNPDYLPAPVPPATHYAAIGDVAAVPVNQRGRALYRLFLTKPVPRAFFVTPSGGSAAFVGGLDPLGRGLRTCQAQFHCEPYAVDNTIVWTGHAPAMAGLPPARAVTEAVPAGRTSLIDFAYDVRSDCSVQRMPQLRIVQAPAHGVARIAEMRTFPRFPPHSPFAACDQVRVPGIALDYTPRPGFTGSDVLSFEVIQADARRAYRVSLLVR